MFGFVVEDLLAGAGASRPHQGQRSLQSFKRIGIVPDGGLISQYG
jgi:hypothetical protein